MFFELSASTLDPKRLRMRCLCGAEYLETTPDAPNTPPATFGCPNCGRLIAVAYSVDRGPSQTYVKFRIEALQRLLQKMLAMKSLPSIARKSASPFSNKSPNCRTAPGD